MASLLLEDIPPEVLEQIEQKAAHKHISVQDEVMTTLRQIYAASSSFSQKLDAFLQVPRDEQWDEDWLQDLRHASNAPEPESCFASLRS